MENWKPVNGYKYYQISSLGRIKSKGIFYRKNKKGKEEFRIMKQLFDKDGYCNILLTENKIRKRFLVHRIVAIHFLEIPIELKKVEKNILQINHKDNNPQNNEVSNLEWVTPKQNSNRRYKKIKLTEDNIEKIIKYNQEGKNFEEIKNLF